MLQTQPEMEHIGSATSTNGVICIDVKTARGIICRSDVSRLLDDCLTVTVYDAEDIIRHIGMPHAIGRAWITRSGRGVMYLINGIQYISSLAQVIQVMDGERTLANISFIWWRPSPIDNQGAATAEVQG